MRINDAGLRLIKQFEGCKLSVYEDIRGLPTVGYGHRTDLPVGTKITQAEADDLLKQDLARFEDGVSKVLTKAVNSNQFSAMVCLAYNIGLTAFDKSSLVSLLNSGRLADCSAQFAKWSKADGHTVSGLLRRRIAERELFELPV